MTKSIHDPQEKLSQEDAHPREPSSAAPLPSSADGGEAPAWERIGQGRYRPRRIRGSYRGRELG